MYFTNCCLNVDTWDNRLSNNILKAWINHELMLLDAGNQMEKETSIDLEEGTGWGFTHEFFESPRNHGGCFKGYIGSLMISVFCDFLCLICILDCLWYMAMPLCLWCCIFVSFPWFISWFFSLFHFKFWWSWELAGRRKFNGAYVELCGTQ